MSPCQSLQDSGFDCNIAVYHGRIDQQAPGFLAFLQHYCLSSGSIGFFLEHTEKLLQDYAVPLAIINCKKLAEVASDFKLHKNPTKRDILSVMENPLTVAEILNRPGQRYKGPGGAEVAATKIQAAWRCCRARKAYVHLRQQQWASGVIAASWLSHNHVVRVKKSLKESRRRHLENFSIRAKVHGATSCYGSTAFLNISCFSDPNKLLPFFSPLTIHLSESHISSFISDSAFVAAKSVVVFPVKTSLRFDFTSSVRKSIF